jgi:hypothetical protein
VKTLDRERFMAAPRRALGAAMGQICAVHVVKASDRNEFVQETFAGIAVAAGNAPIPAVRLT